MYQMAAYCRLSKDDGESKISESIENQMKMIREYVSKSDDLEIADIYIDDGYSGLYFANRPEFQRMISNCKCDFEKSYLYWSNGSAQIRKDFL